MKTQLEYTDSSLLELLDDRIEAAYASSRTLKELGDCARRYRVGNTLTLPDLKSIALTGGTLTGGSK